MAAASTKKESRISQDLLLFGHVQESHNKVGFWQKTGALNAGLSDSQSIEQAKTFKSGPWNWRKVSTVRSLRFCNTEWSQSEPRLRMKMYAAAYRFESAIKSVVLNEYKSWLPYFWKELFKQLYLLNIIVFMLSSFCSQIPLFPDTVAWATISLFMFSLYLRLITLLFLDTYEHIYRGVIILLRWSRWRTFSNLFRSVIDALGRVWRAKLKTFLPSLSRSESTHDFNYYTSSGINVLFQL